MWLKTGLKYLNYIKAPKIINSPQWVKVKDCLPIRNGMYYVSDGVSSDIALFSKDKQAFIRVSSGVSIDLWCYNLGTRCSINDDDFERGRS
jgi:hypothetical protein